MVNVDIVYKTVLYILNKEQRGYIPPDEFNKLGIQVQREIFEQYFEELNQQLRIPQTNNEYANRIKNLEEKIDVFKTNQVCTGANPFTLPDNLHRLGTLIYNVNSKEIQGVNRNEYFLINKSPLVAPTTSNPLYVLEGTGTPSAAPSTASVFPDSITTGQVDAYYIKAPRDPQWGYVVGLLGQYEYNDAEALTFIEGSDLIGAITSSASQYITASLPNSSPHNGNVTGTTGYTTNGAGSGVDLTITIDNSFGGNYGVVSSIVVGNLIGSGFQIGDTITIDGTILGGSSDLILTLRPQDLNTNTANYSTNFELHPSEQTNIILNILMYSGVIIRDPQIVQTAATMIQQDETVEKQ